MKSSFLKLINIIGAVLIVTACSSLYPPRVLAADQPNIMFMGEDADQDTVPRNSRIFNRVSDALRSQMQEQGFQVYNETATTMDATNPSRVRRTDAELIATARSAAAVPIDVITTFQIYASEQKNAYADIKELRIRVVGRLLQVQNGKDLGNFEVSMGPKGLKPLPVNCNRDCILEAVGDQAKIIANEVGNILAKKLDKLSPSSKKASSEVKAIETTENKVQQEVTTIGKKAACTGLPSSYTIVITGFDSPQLDVIDSMLTQFPGYQKHRPVRTQTRYAEYYYETCSTEARLEKNMRALSEQLDGDNRMAFSVNKFELEHISDVKTR